MIEMQRTEQEVLADLATQQTFVSLVEGVRKNQVSELPDLVPLLRHDGVYTNNIEERAFNENPGVFLGGKFAIYSTENNFPDRLSFVPQPLLRVGRENSRHNVFMGALNAHWFRDGTDATSQVAVKPIPSQEASSLERQLILHEAAMYQYLGSIGIKSLEVVGISLLAEPEDRIGGYMVTSLEPDLTNMDSLEWNKMGPQERWSELDKALDEIALLHSRLVFHGDFKARNIAFGEAKNDMVAIDMEFATSARDIPEKVNFISKRMSADLKYIADFVVENIYGHHPSEKKSLTSVEMFNLLHNILFEPYFERMMQIGGEYKDVLAKAYAIVIQRQEMLARGEKPPALIN